MAKAQHPPHEAWLRMVNLQWDHCFRASKEEGMLAVVRAMRARRRRVVGRSIVVLFFWIERNKETRE